MSKAPWIREPTLSIIAARYDLGEKVDVIATTFGIDRSLVSKIAKSKGCAMRGQNKRAAQK